MLVMTICSATFQTCLPPSDVRPVYDTHYDCATAGYLNAIGLTREVGQTIVDRDRITVKFECKPVSST